MAKQVDALQTTNRRYSGASKTVRPLAGATPVRGVPLWKLPRSVQVSLRDRKKQIEQAAFERRYHARNLLFGKAGGKMRNLAKEEQRYVRFVWEEAYSVYLHAFRTGETRYQGWAKRRQRTELQNRVEPMNRKGHYNQWWRSQKARYFRFDLPRKLQDG